MTKRVMGSVRAELLKMKHTFLIPFHVAVPVIIAGFMLFYYRGTIGNPMGQTMAYFELIGIGLPFVVSIVCAGNIGLEEQNHFQVFLGNYKVKGKGFVVKGVVLFGMGVLAIFGAAVLFCCRVSFFTGKRGDWHAVCAADGDTDFRKCAVVSGAFVPESDLSKDRIPVRGRGAVGGVRLVSHRAWGGQMAVFSGYVECKGHSVLQ